MRRRRQTLHVSTFPFLAVLLCAMGSLILVLLVMDRRARLAAGARARQQAARLSEEAARAAAGLRAEWERKRQEARRAREQKRAALHTRLLSEEQLLQAQTEKTRRELAEAAARLRAEEEDAAGLRRRIEEERNRVAGAEKALAGSRTAAARADGRAAGARGGLARMTADLLQLEQALKDLKAARERERQTYSVVPYHGKRGESRRPLYVECAADGVVFHPDRLRLDVAARPAEVRAEVERRIARQGERYPDDARNYPRPYLLLLVRPDGIDRYYQLQAALRDLALDFGYECIDPDWVLDFPTDDQAPSPQPWMTVAKPDHSPPRPAPASPPPHGIPRLGSGSQDPGTPREAPGLQPRGRSSGPRDPGTPLAAGLARSPASSPSPSSPSRDRPGAGPSPFADGRGSGPGGGTGGGPNVGVASPGSGGGILGTPSPTIGFVGVGSGHDTGFGPPTLGSAPYGPGESGGLSEPRPSGSGVLGGSGPGLSSVSAPTALLPPGAVGSGGDSGSAGAPAPRGVLLSPGGPQASGNPGGSPASTSSGVPSAAGGTPTNSGTAGPNPPGAPSGPGAGPGARGQGSPDDGPGNSGGQPAGDEPAAGGTRRGPPPSGAGDGNGAPAKPEDEALARRLPTPLPPAPSRQPSRRPVSLRPAQLHGNRDWVIYVECQADALVLYPSRQRFPLATLTRDGNNPLLQAVQQMIARRQALLRPGEPPYRPEIRFLMRPENLGTFHLAYPALDPLPVPKRRQNLDPDDDVDAITAGP